MKFECGKSKRLKKAAKKEWHRWFAWHRVKVGYEDCRWLEVIERRQVQTEKYDREIGAYTVTYWEYRA